MDGLEVLQKLQAHNEELPVVMISGHGTIDTAVDALKKGAFDFIEKPPNISRILVKRAQRTGPRQPCARDQGATSKGGQGQGRWRADQRREQSVGRHPRHDREGGAERCALITGGNGAGKEGVARTIHEKSQRAQGPYVEVNCAAIPGELIESELFGHVKGSFTSAIKDRKGKFELADGGTLFLDEELGDMALRHRPRCFARCRKGASPLWVATRTSR